LLKFISILLALLLIQCGQSPEDSLQQTPTMAAAPVAPDLPPPPGLVAEGAQWETLAEGYIYSEGPAADSDGNVFYAEAVFMHLYKVDAEGRVTQFDANTEMTMGLVMGPDGLLYGCRNRAGQIVRYDPNSNPATYEVLLEGEVTPLKNKPTAPGEFCNDMAISSQGLLWFTDRINRRVILLRPDGSSATVASGWRPNGIVLSADQQTLVVTDSDVAVLHAFAVASDGTLLEKPGLFDPVRTVESLGKEVIAPGRPGTDGMTVDSDGRYYLASFYGIQIFDRKGKYVGVIKRPSEFVSNLTFGGPEYGYLYATGRNGIYRLKMQVRGVGR
jgi:gluconolactonase